MDGLGRLAKVRVAGSNPVVRSNETLGFVITRGTGMVRPVPPRTTASLAVPLRIVGDPQQSRPIGCYVAAAHLAEQ